MQLERKERSMRLFKAINELSSEKQKVAFTLSKIEGLSYTEIAENSDFTPFHVYIDKKRFDTLQNKKC